MRGRARQALAAEPDDARLDHDAPARPAALAARPDQHAPNATAAPDPGTGEPAPAAATLAAGAVDRGAHAMRQRTVVADPRQPQFEVVVGHDRSLKSINEGSGGTRFKGLHRQPQLAAAGSLYGGNA